MKATGPYCGSREDQFAVSFDIEMTPKGSERVSMHEVALYTVKDEKVVEEQFLPLIG